MPNCISSYTVSRVEVLSFDAGEGVQEIDSGDDVKKSSITNDDGAAPSEGRYEVIVHQSFKNRVPLLHKEFLWISNSTCVCPKLRVGRMYLVMGSTKLSSNGREVRLELDNRSYVRRYNNRVSERITGLRNNEMKYCAKYRSSHNNYNADRRSVNILSNHKEQLLSNNTRYHIDNLNATYANLSKTSPDNVFYFLNIQEEKTTDLQATESPREKEPVESQQRKEKEKFSNNEIDSFIETFASDSKFHKLKRTLLDMKYDENSKT